MIGYILGVLGNIIRAVNTVFVRFIPQSLVLASIVYSSPNKPESPGRDLNAFTRNSFALTGRS